MRNNNVQVITWWVAPSQHLSFQSPCWISLCLFHFSPWAETESFNLHCVLAWALTLIDNKPIKLEFWDCLEDIQGMSIEIRSAGPLWSSINNFLNECLSVNGSKPHKETVARCRYWHSDQKENDEGPGRQGEQRGQWTVGMYLGN